MTNTTDIVKSNSNTNLIPFNNEELDELVKAAGITGVTSRGQLLMVFKKAQELGIGPANAISHIHVVNGKSGIDIHLVKAILSKPSAGITWDLIENFQPLYNYTDGETVYSHDEAFDGNGNLLVLLQLKDNPLVDKAKDDGKIPVVKLPSKDAKGKRIYEVVDYRTTYKFTRLKQMPDKTWHTDIKYSSFSWNEAVTAGLPLDKTGNIALASPWYKYKKLMVATRAFTYGARDIASDLLNGNYETTELYEFNDIAYDVTEEGKTTILKK